MALLLLQHDVHVELRNLALLGRSEKAESLSGRIPLWSELMAYVQQRPLVGYGYDSFWSADHIDELSRQLQWAVRDSHSSYIETLLNVGAIGAALLAGIVALATLQAGRSLGSGTGYQFLFGLFLYAVINGGTESLMTAPTFIPFIILCGISRLAFFSTTGAADECD
jgi:O-antigen ligase